MPGGANDASANTVAAQASTSGRARSQAGASGAEASTWQRQTGATPSAGASPSVPGSCSTTASQPPSMSAAACSQAAR